MKEKYSQSIESDPIYWVHQYSRPEDQELVAFISASLAFGQVKSIQQSVGKILKLLGPSPHQTLLNFEKKFSEKDFKELGHRWVRGRDLWCLCFMLQNILREKGRFKKYFFDFFKEEDLTIAPLLTCFSEDMKSRIPRPHRSRGVNYFFPSPADGSPCKRLNMFLRWMVRPNDGVDLGLWPELGTQRLIIPLDTHLYQFAKKFKISCFKNTSWKMAEELTGFLRQINPADPVSLDYLICHYGMEKGWG